jgi:hypothetical protein
MNKLTLAKEKLSQYEYIVTLNENSLRQKLQEANDVIRDFVSKFERPELFAPELVEYLEKNK